MLRKAPFCMGDFSKNFLSFFSPDGSRIRFPLPGKRRGTVSGKRLFCISSIPVGFDFPYQGNEGEQHQGSAFFASLPSSLVSIPPTGETKGSDIRSQAGILRCRSGRRLDCVPLAHGAPFFLQKGPSCKISHRDILQFTPENAPYGKGDFALWVGRPGLLAPGSSPG